MNAPNNPNPIPKLTDNEPIKPDYHIRESLLSPHRPDVQHLSMFGVPVTQLNTDELQCLLVMVARQADRLGQELFRARSQLSNTPSNFNTDEDS